MKKIIRIMSLLLALLMVVSVFASCGETKPNDEDKNDTTASTSGDDTTEKVLPQLNWGGQEYRVLGKESTTTWAHSFEVYREEMPEDVVGKAVYERNQALYDKYGFVVSGKLTSSYNSTAKTALESGDDLYDLMILSPESFHPHAMSGYLLNLYELDYINMDHNGWMDYPNEQLSMGGRLYYTTNKFLLQDKNRSWLLYYNREMARELNLGYFEESVFDGSWTLDKLIEVGKKATSDSDGQPGMTIEDNWGVAVAEHYSFTQFAYGAGFRFTEQGSDGYPVLLGASDKIISTLDAVYGLTANKDVYYCDQDYGTVNWDDCADQMFYEGRALTLAMCVSALDYLGSEVDFEFGILPNPKLDDKQEDYYSIPNLGNGSLFAVPATVIDPAFAGFALQALTEESVDTTYNTYIETKCKLQDAFDEDAAKCLDLVFEGIVYDIAFVSDIGGLGSMMRGTLGGLSNNTFGRLFDRLKKIADKEMATIKETYSTLP